MPSIPTDDTAASRATRNRLETRAMQTLMGMVTGIVADQRLHDLEISLLSTWLSSNQETAQAWPGCAIASKLRAVLADGVVTDDERTHLLGVLTELANTDFAATGSAVAEPLRLPIDDTVSFTWTDAGVVHTGEFTFGTRDACERLSVALGARALGTVTRKTHVLVIGTRVSPFWVNESYGRKIMQATRLRDGGHPINIVSERFWFSAAQLANLA